MMDSLRQYFFSIICAAFVCTIVLSITQNSSVKKTVKLLCGVVLTITVMQPISKINFEDFHFLVSYENEGEVFSAEGTSMAKEAMSAIIKSETEAYILDKATEMGANLSAEVSLDSNCIPVSVCLSGDAASNIKIRLEEILEKEIGITKENQRWIG